MPRPYSAVNAGIPSPTSASPIALGRHALVFAFFAVASLYLGGVAAEPAHAASCTQLVTSCAKSAAKTGKGTASIIQKCRGVRKCRQTCRSVKREAASVCRGGKSQCKSQCRSKFGRGRDFRKCRRSCRGEKRSCKREVRQDKRECRSDCRETFLTPACRKARFKIIGTALKSVAACGALATCVIAPRP